MKKISFVVCALAASLLAAQGVVLLSDSFAYPNGSLVTVAGTNWVHHSGSTTGEVNVVSGRVFVTQTKTEDVSAFPAGQPYPATTNLFLYASFTLNVSNAPTGAGNFFAHYKAAGTAGSQAGKIFVTTNGVPAGFYRVGMANSTSTPNVTLPNNLSFNTDYKLVTRYAPSNAATVLWLNPATENDTAAVATDSGTTITVVAFALRQSLASGDGMGGLFFDDLLVGTSFADVVSNQPPTAPFIITPPQSQTVTQGANVMFTVEAGGTTPFSYQWKFNDGSITNATGTTLLLTNVTLAQTGEYTVTVTNVAGATNSQAATLTVTLPPPPSVAGFSLVHYNVKGNGATDWTTNAPQVRAIARQLQYLNPDIVAFNEIPNDYYYEMTNFVAAFLPGYKLAINSGTDTYIRSAIVSRFAITRSTSWLDSADLSPYGYTSADFTRDLFEAQITMPGFPQPLHVLTTHLKSSSGGYTDAAAKRAAEAAAITNWFATYFFVQFPNHPYTLSGDLNDEVTNHGTNTLALERLLSTPTGLQLTNPTNPFTGDIDTYTTADANPSERIDYILPCPLLGSNIASAQVFRTDRLTPLPPNLNSNDCKVASDHLPVMMVFNNPYDKPFRLTSVTRSNQTTTLTWEAVFGQPYRVDSSSNLTAWSMLASNLVATNSTFIYRTNLSAPAGYFRVYRVP